MKYNKALILLLLLFMNNLGIYSQQCFPDGIIFESQQDIDNFKIDFPYCSSIIGNVIIGNNFGDINNLDSLSNIDTIYSDLQIVYNPIIIDIDGLQNLKYIGGSLIVKNNYDIESISGLVGLNFIGQNLIIDGNYELKNLIGLDSISSIPEIFQIINNGNLTQLTGLENLSSVGISLKISGSKILNVDQLYSLDSIGTFLYLSGNKDLTDLSGLVNLVFIGSSLYINNNDALESLSGLDNFDFEELNFLSIQGNKELSYCEIQSVCSFLEINSPDKYSINKTGCQNEDEVKIACGIVNTSDIEFNPEIKIFPNPTNEIIKIDGIIKSNRIRIELFTDVTQKNR